jgi:beta-ureidopropionase / N-carbamoyl-L-amino-acid hydrolase
MITFGSRGASILRTIGVAIIPMGLSLNKHKRLMSALALTISQINSASTTAAMDLLGTLYEHSPWVAQRALTFRPFKSLHHFKTALSSTLQAATKAEQLALIRAHPELAGKAMVAQTLTEESTNEQSRAGLTQCTPEEFSTIQSMNAAYNAKFDWPFILAVRGPRGTGLSKAQIMSTFERRLAYPLDYEFAECLRQINRIAEIRLQDKFEIYPTLGNAVWDWQEELAQFSDPGFKEAGQLTVTYLTEAHRACAALLQSQMRTCGFDEVSLDAVGNVVGVYKSADASAQTLLTGSHYDTVRNGGKYDGRLGIYAPMMCVRELAKQGTRLPFNIEVVGFAEEEGQRYKATFLGSSAVTGDFDPEWLDQCDAQGISMRQAMLDAGLPATLEAIHKIKRDPNHYLGFVEVHIEQGPVLNALNLPLGVVTSINGSVRYLCEVSGMAAHAGTTPMHRRKDAAVAVAQMMLAVEARALQDADSVATVGQLHVPSGSINVIPGGCQFSIDLRAPINAQRDALEADILSALKIIAEQRGVNLVMNRILEASAAPSDPLWQAKWVAAVSSLGLPVHTMASGAGHDAMKLHTIMPQAMLFVRGENAGISHNPLESSTADDIDLAVQALQSLLYQLASNRA